MDLQQIMNSPGLWIASSFMLLFILILAVYYLRLGLRRAKDIGLEKDRTSSAIRSAVITSIGPSLSPCIVLLSMITVLGAPTTWMRMNDVGAARTELSIVTMACGLLGIDPTSGDFGVQAFSYSVWAMALNNLGWFVVTLVLTSRMGKAVNWMYGKYDRKWINMLMAGATFGVTGYLLADQIVAKFLVADASIFLRMKGLIPAVIAGAVMLLINKFIKSQRMQELALGIAMLVGMFAGQAIYGS